MSLREVSIVGIGQLPVQKQASHGLREMGAEAVRLALAEAGMEPAQLQALYASNMLADELQNQKHIATLIADEAGLVGVEALEVRAATAAGAAALRVAYLAVASGQVETAVAVGVEQMSSGLVTSALAKALDAQREVPDGKTLLSQNAWLMHLYQTQYGVPEGGLANFPITAHANAQHNPLALFHDKPITAEDVLASRLITPPLRLLDCAPICDGAAAVILVPTAHARRYTDTPVQVIASATATDRFRVADRPRPLQLVAAELSAQRAFAQAGVGLADIGFFELHDAFSIMACLLLEAVGFAKAGEGWRMAAEGELALSGRLPIATLGGLKARGHPIGATALYQTCEIVRQLTGRAGHNQLPNPRTALLQSVGGAAATVITHLFR